MMKSEHYKKLERMAKLYQQKNPAAAKREEKRLQEKLERFRLAMRNRPITIKSIPMCKPLAFVLKDVERTFKEDVYTNQQGLKKNVEFRYLKTWNLNWTSPKTINRVARIKISETIWTNIVLLSKMLKERNFEQGGIILMYRKQKHNIAVAFATNKQYAEYVAPMIKRNIRKEYTTKIPWFDIKTSHDKQMFEKYYGGDIVGVENRTESDK